jgi:hypothetical protein
MYTVISDYSASGEGRSIMVMYTRGLPQWPHWDDPNKDGQYWALKQFKEKFGDWFASGATVYSGMIFDFDGSDLLLSSELKNQLQSWENTAGGLEYYASIHFNFS